MKGMGKFIKLLILTFTTTVFLVCCSSAMAHEATVWNTMPQLNQQMHVPTFLQNGDILIDNFEYWDDVRNHDWVIAEPDYPTWGYGVGYGQLTTVVDFQEGSRVLDVNRPPSVFLPFQDPPLWDPSQDTCRYMPFTIIKNFVSCCSAPLPGALHWLSFKVRAPLAIEEFDTFRFVVDITTKRGGYLRIVFIPRDRKTGCAETSLESITPKDAPSNIPNPPAVVPDVVEVFLGRDFQDGTWHLVMQDLQAILDTYLGAAPHETIAGITQIMVRGNQYRLDDITFTAAGNRDIGCPYLYKTGPLFVQLFTSVQKLVFAEDHQGNIFDVITNPIEIYQKWAQDSQNGFADPQIYWADAPTNTTPRYPGDAQDWTAAQLVSIKDFIANRNPAGRIDPNIPVLMDDDMRTTPQGSHHTEDMLRFSAFVGGGAASGAASSIITPLPINFGDSKPLFLPAYYHFGTENPHYAQFGHGHPTAIGSPQDSEGSFYYSKQRVDLIELALANAGYTVWPNVAVLSFQPQVMEDLIITVEVSNGLSRDVETFPVSVTNYPVENYPPLMEDLDDQIGYVGEPFLYSITAIDMDSCLYSGEGCTDTHPKLDQYTLTFSATIAGLPSYQYGPWSESIIDPHTGVIDFTPQFEGAYPMVVKITDDRGLYSVGEFTVFCVNRGTHLNHPPVMLGDWDHPQVCRAGDLLVLDSEIDVEDPDGDRIYYSCNIGSIGEDSNGNPVWSFQTQFPGFYVVDIVAMDARGAFTSFTIDVDVRPWWSL